MIIINAKLKINANKREDYLELMKKLVINSRKEDGSLFYHHYGDVIEKNVLIIVENYKNEQAVQARNRSDHFKVFNDNTNQYLIEEPQISVSQPIQS